MKKLSKRQPTLRKLSKRSTPDAEKFVSEMRQKVKEDPVIIDKFKEYGVSLDDIDGVHIEFCELETSAKTKDKKIYLNEIMLEDGNDTDPMRYLVHELVHYLQQETGKNLNKHKTDDDYLDKETEIESFQTQIEHMENEVGEGEVDEYLEGLLDHHDLDGAEREEKKEELLD